MKRFILSLTFLLCAIAGYAQDDVSRKAMALKLSVYILDLSDKRADMDGPYQEITGELAQTTDNLEILKTRNFAMPGGVTQHYLFRAPKKWPSFAASLSPEGAQAMKMAITDILPREKPVGAYTSRNSSDEQADTYLIVQNGKTIGSLSIKKASGIGMLIMSSGY